MNPEPDEKHRVCSSPSEGCREPAADLQRHVAEPFAALGAVHGIVTEPAGDDA